MNPESLLVRILQQKDTRNLVGIGISLAVAFILGRQIAVGQTFFPFLLIGISLFLLLFFRKDSVIYLLPAVLFLPNLGLDIPGPWAVTMEDAFILVLFAGFLSRAIIRRENIIPRGSPIILPLGLFLIVAAISLFKSVQTGAGTLLINTKDLMRLTELVLLFIALYALIDSEQKAVRLLRNFLILGIFYMIVSYYIYLTKSTFFYDVLTMVPAYIYIKPHNLLRMVSIAGSTSQTGMFYAILLAIALFFTGYRKNRQGRLVRIMLIIALCSCVFLTFNRGTWVGLLLALFIMLVRGGMDWKKVALASVALILLAAILLVTVFGQMDVEQQALRFFHVSKSSGLARWVRWVSSVNVIIEQPFLGVGYNNYAWVYGRYSVAEGDVQEYGSPHNMFVDIITGTGIIGFAVFMYFFLQLWKMFRRVAQSRIESIRNNGLGLYFAFLAFFGASIFDSFFYKPHHTGMLIVTTWAIANALWRVDRSELPSANGASVTTPMETGS